MKGKAFHLGLAFFSVRVVCLFIVQGYCFCTPVSISSWIFFCFHFADVFNCHMWKSLKAATSDGNGPLSSLAESLPDVFLASG